MLQRSLRRERTIAYATALAIWALLGYSAGWYFTLTGFGLQGWPLPLPEAAAAMTAHRMAGSMFAREGAEALRWVAMFPLAGFVWVGVLWLTAAAFGGQPQGYAMTLRTMAWPSAPVAAMAPVALLVLFMKKAFSPWGALVFDFRRTAGLDHLGWLGPTYIALALTGLALQLAFHRRTFGLERGKVAPHFALGLLLLVLVMIGGQALTEMGFRLARDTMR